MQARPLLSLSLHRQGGGSTDKWPEYPQATAGPGRRGQRAEIVWAIREGFSEEVMFESGPEGA